MKDKVIIYQVFRYPDGSCNIVPNNSELPERMIDYKDYKSLQLKYYELMSDHVHCDVKEDKISFWKFIYKKIKKGIRG